MGPPVLQVDRGCHNRGRRGRICRDESPEHSIATPWSVSTPSRGRS